MKDIIQLCPISSASFMGYVDNDIYSGKQLDIINIYNEINGLFDYFEKIFTENNFYAAIVRPKGLMDTVATYVAIKFGVPSTFFHSSYFGSDAVWANGPFMEQSSLNTFMSRPTPKGNWPLAVTQQRLEKTCVTIFFQTFKSTFFNVMELFSFFYFRLGKFKANAPLLCLICGGLYIIILQNIYIVKVRTV